MLLGWFEAFPLILLMLIVVALLGFASRGDPDPGGQRPYLAYLLIATFLGIFIALGGLFQFVHAAGSWAVGENGPDFSNLTQYSCAGDGPCAPQLPVAYADFDSIDSPLGSGGLPGTVLGAAVFLAGAVVARAHWSKARAVVEVAGFGEGSARRPYEIFLYTTCLAALLVLLGAAIETVRGLLGVAFGGSYFYGDRASGLVGSAAFGSLAAGASSVLRAHWRRVEALRGGRTEGAEN
ncbi:MAG: hypothetical protein LC722_06050 [Actinobacteria bacterium]|nr:hypothetical protein [Actinomycetota bacterium]